MRRAHLGLIVLAIGAVIAVRAVGPATSASSDAPAAGPAPPSVEPLPQPSGVPSGERAGGDGPEPRARRGAVERTVLRMPRPPAPPRAIEIPRLGIRSSIVRVGLDRRGRVAVPGPRETGWFDGSVEPGKPGPSILVGHVDSRTGPAVFYTLPTIARGDLIRVTLRDGSRARFEVTRVVRYRRTEVPAAVYAPTPAPTLRLITCGGPFDPADGYRDNIVVYAAAAGAGGPAERMA